MCERLKVLLCVGCSQEGTPQSELCRGLRGCPPQSMVLVTLSACLALFISLGKGHDFPLTLLFHLHFIYSESSRGGQGVHVVELRSSSNAHVNRLLVEASEQSEQAEHTF